MGVKSSFPISKLQARKLKINSTLIFALIAISFLQYLALNGDNSFLNRLIFKPCMQVQAEGVWTLVEKQEQKYSGEIRFIGKSSTGVEVLLLLGDLPWKPLNVGDKVEVDAKVYNVCFPNDGEYQLPRIRSYRGYLYRKGISAYLRVKEFLLVYDLPHEKSLKDRLIEKLLDRFGSENESLAVVLAATLGEKSLLGKDLEGLFQKLGISHLLVVSGFHVGVIFAMLYFLLSKMVPFIEIAPHILPTKCITKTISLLACALYVNFVGIKLTTLRAILMLMVAVLASIHKTELLNLRGLLICALISVLVWPGCFLDLSFQLVFSALFGIYLALWVLAKLTLKKIWNKLIGALLVSLFAWLTTAPVLYLQLNYFNYMQPLINLIVSPVFSFLCISLGVFGLLIYALFGLDEILSVSLFFTEILLKILQKI